MNNPVGGLVQNSINKNKKLLHGLGSQNVGTDLPQDIRLLVDFGVGLPALHYARDRARQFNVPALSILINTGTITEREYYQNVAAYLKLDFAEATFSLNEPLFSAPTPSALERMSRFVWVTHEFNEDQQNFIHIAPDCNKLDALHKFLETNPSLRKRLRVTTLSANRKSIEHRSAPSLLRLAIDGLADQYPSLSAKRVISVSQAVFMVLILQLLIVLALSNYFAVVLGLHLMGNFFFISCSSLRLFAAVQQRDEDINSYLPRFRVDRGFDPLLPLYSVLVPVYREAGQIKDLVGAIQRLDWPMERIEVKIICEADDLETIAAAENILSQRSAWSGIFQIVKVPPSKPRTKPKALNFALPMCRGELVVIYDAEDRPHRLQLREAYARFVSGAPELACLQAPLIIHNYREGWLPQLFAIEYSALFDGLLPMLANQGTPLPLGGTSNHFKRKVLDNIGAWDPYNVTEDADLGMRMSRAGYKIETLRLPTYEEAPINLGVWLKQRTRWFNGWYQTFLVHIRNPIKLMRELGIQGSLVFFLMTLGMAVSALVHPIIIYFVLSSILQITDQGFLAVVSHPLILFDIFTILVGYLSFIFLALQTLKLRKFHKLKNSLWLIPLYWLLLSAAAWRALWHLTFRPHEWEKTPHRIQR